MNKLMSSSMFGLAPIAPTETLISNQDEEWPAAEQTAMEEKLARIREELNARGAERTKHAHWCSVLLRATWRRVYQADSAGKNRRS